MTKRDVQQILQDEASRWNPMFSRSDMLSKLYWAMYEKGLRASLINDRYLLVEDFEFSLRKKDGDWVIKSY